MILPTCQTKFWNVGLIRRTGAIGSTLRPTSTNCCVNGWPLSTPKRSKAAWTIGRTILTARWRFASCSTKCRAISFGICARLRDRYRGPLRREVHSGIWLRPVIPDGRPPRALLPAIRAFRGHRRPTACSPALKPKDGRRPRHRICPASFGDHRQVRTLPTSKRRPRPILDVRRSLSS